MTKEKFLALLLSFSFLVGCSKKEETKIVEETNDDLTKTKVMSEDIKLTMVKPSTINPIHNKNESVNYILSLVYDGLFTIDENYDIVPQLVSEYGINSDGLSIDIKLKDAYWHDGESVTSYDVDFTINLIKENVDSIYNVFTQNIEDIDIVDNKNFTINFKEKNAFSMDTLTFPIVCKNQLENVEDINNYKNNLVGNGKYRIAQYEERQGVFLQANKNYYDKEMLAKNDIDVEIVPDIEAQSSMLLSLKSDISSISLNNLSSFYEDEFKIKKFEGRDFDSAIFNYENIFIRDINFRKAISSIIDRSIILEEAYMSDARLVNFPLNSTSKYYHEEVQTISYDKEKAKKYLEDMDFKNIQNLAKQEGVLKEENSEEVVDDNKELKEDAKLDDNEKLENNQSVFYSEEKIKIMLKNLDLKIIVNKENAERVKTAHIIKQGLKDIGLNSTVYELQGIDLDIALKEKEYDIALIGWELSSIPDATNIIESIGYTDKKLQGYITSLRNAVTQNQISDIYKSLQIYVNENALFIPLVIRDDYLVYNSRLKGKINPNSFDIYEGISNLDV